MKEYWLCPNCFYDIKHVERANLWTRIMVWLELGLRKPIAKCQARDEEDAARTFYQMGYWLGYYNPWRVIFESEKKVEP